MTSDLPCLDRPAPPRITPLGLDGVLVSFADTLSDPANRAALAFRAEIDAQGWEFLREAATSLTSTYLAFDTAQISHADLTGRLSALLNQQDWLQASLPADRARWTIPVCFETDCAPHLAEAADLAGVSPDAAIAELTAKPLRALALGYAPGQAYLGTLPAHWGLDRMRDLTPKVPLGAVVTAVRQVIVFATSGPTGWRQIGLSRFEGFRPQSDTDPIALSPGDEVQFTRISRDDLDRLSGPDGGATREPLG